MARVRFVGWAGIVVVAVAVVAACSSSPATPASDAGPLASDAAPIDAQADTTPGDSAPPDASVPDAPVDATPVDAALPDAADAATLPPPSSCVGGLTCQGIDCCDSPVVPGGSFPMGRSDTGSDAFASGVADEQPEHAVTVSSFQLNAFEVTVGRFRKFVDAYAGPPAAGAGAHPRIAGSGWDAAWNANMPADAAALRANVKCAANAQWTDTAGANEARPMNCANWYEAFAFCAWDGGRMPTEAELEYASAGGSENRLYPWGSATPTTSLASFALPLGSSPELAGSVPAGNGRWGHRDLAGSLNEWALDSFDAAWYTGGGATCTDCANLAPSAQRVYRGGYFGGISSILRGAARGKGDPASHTFAFATGFRCARSL